MVASSVRCLLWLQPATGELCCRHGRVYSPDGMVATFSVAAFTFVILFEGKEANAVPATRATSVPDVLHGLLLMNDDILLRTVRVICNSLLLM